MATGLAAWLQDAFSLHTGPIQREGFGVNPQIFSNTKFGQLIIRKIIKIVAKKRQILHLKCTKFTVGCGSAPDPAGGACGAPQAPYMDPRGPTSKGREGKQWSNGNP